jgi:ElaB/YqjD/DUF883 family membrane-anchored ribosome-binding protein
MASLKLKQLGGAIRTRIKYGKYCLNPAPKKDIMSKVTTHTHSRLKTHADHVSDHTHALLAATADVVDEKVVEVRKQLMAALSAAKEACVSVQEKAVKSAKNADKIIRGSPYQAAGVAFGVGALAGLILSLRAKKPQP